MAKNSNKKKSKKRWINIILLILAVVIVGSIIWKNAQAPDAIPVTLSEADRRDITQTVSAIGSIQPETEVKVSSETSGEIIFVGVQEGDTVKRGQLLIRINPDIVQTQLEQTKAASGASKQEIESRRALLENARSDYNRIQELYKKNFVSQQELDAARSNFESAEAAFESAKMRYEQALASQSQVERSKERTTIYSPIDGIVTLLNVEVGEKAVGTELMQGTELMRISDLSEINAVVKVDENDIVKVSKGDTANVEIDAFPNKIFKGYVFEIGHSALVESMGTQDQVINFEVKVRLLDTHPRIRPGMSCNVDIMTETKYNVIAVPLQSVTVRDMTNNLEKNPDVNERRIRKENDGSANGAARKMRPPSVVFVKKGDAVSQRAVETGISDQGFIEIISGLEDGETIVSGNFEAVSRLLFDNAKITVDSAQSRRRGMMNR